MLPWVPRLLGSFAPSASAHIITFYTVSPCHHLAGERRVMTVTATRSKQLKQNDHFIGCPSPRRAKPTNNCSAAGPLKQAAITDGSAKVLRSRKIGISYTAHQLEQDGFDTLPCPSWGLKLGKALLA